MKNPANCATVCQVTHGAEPKYANDPFAQWIKRRLAELGWQKQDLEAAVLKQADDRLGEAGAKGVVRRATYGLNQKAENRALIQSVLGPFDEQREEEDLRARLEALEAKVAEMATGADLRAGLESLRQTIAEAIQDIRQEIPENPSGREAHPR